MFAYNDPKTRKNFLKEKGLTFCVWNHLTWAITSHKGKPHLIVKVSIPQKFAKSETSDHDNNNETGETSTKFSEFGFDFIMN